MIRLTLVFVLVSAALAARAEEKEPTLAEAKTEFAKADRTLNEAWAAAKKALPEAIFAELQTKQRDWLEFRENRARAETGRQDEAEAKRSPSYFTTLTFLTEDRARWLRAQSRKEDDTLTGRWRDSFGGNLEIVEQKGRLLFVFQTVRGKGYDVGNLAGVATWNTRIGWFSDKGRDKDKSDETNISFTERNGQLEVIGANTSYYHGNRAYFDGTYSKIAPLDDKEAAIVLKAAESGIIPEE